MQYSGVDRLIMSQYWLISFLSLWHTYDINNVYTLRDINSDKLCHKKRWSEKKRRNFAGLSERSLTPKEKQQNKGGEKNSAIKYSTYTCTKVHYVITTTFMQCLRNFFSKIKTRFTKVWISLGIVSIQSSHHLCCCDMRLS